MALFGSGFAQASDKLKEIKLYDTLHLVNLEVSAQDDVQIRFFREKIYDMYPDFTRPVLELEFLVMWPGCGWFNDKNRVLISSENNNNNNNSKITLFTLTESNGFACSGGLDRYRIFKYKLYPVISEEVTIADKIKINIVFTPNPKGEEYRPTFNKIEITKPKGEVIVLTSDDIIK